LDLYNETYIYGDNIKAIISAFMHMQADPESVSGATAIDFNVSAFGFTTNIFGVHGNLNANLSGTCLFGGAIDYT
jgi:hypothetical protein